MDESNRFSNFEPELHRKSVSINLNIESMPQQKFAKTARSIKKREASIKKKKLNEEREKLRLLSEENSPSRAQRKKHPTVCEDD